MSPSNPGTTLLPILALLLAATLWGVLWYPLRLLEQVGLQGLWTTLIMYCAASLVGIILAVRHFHEFSRCPGLLLLIGISNGWTNVAFIIAILDGNVVRVLLLFYLSPLWTVILGWLVLGERISVLAATSIGIAMSGALLMLWEPSLGFPWPRDGTDVLAISAGFAFAVSNVLVRKAQNVSVTTKTTATWIGVAALAGFLLLYKSAPTPAVDSDVLMGAIILGIGGIVIMTLAVQYGVTHMPVHRSAVILLFEIVAGALSSQLLTDEIVLPIEWAGGVLIIFAAYLSAHQAVKAK
ncbi:MAG TPA: DMT family transporter [Acidiferrobacteraceae bacterium]|nr:DMT family transporter [Acidiferrobacteraceae bacterium]